MPIGLLLNARVEAASSARLFKRMIAVLVVWVMNKSEQETL
jgi:hypothetical protein